jgi:hypothetical protein
MNYFLDTEFHEYHKQQKVCGIPIGKSIPTIDLISIGIVSEDGREYYAISKDFNLVDAWMSMQENNDVDSKYWLRHNVLMPILNELTNKGIADTKYDYDSIQNYPDIKQLNALLHFYGKPKKQIAEEIKQFVLYKAPIGEDDWCNCDCAAKCPNGKVGSELRCTKTELEIKDIAFYAYYADYDWVVFAQLFDKLINLPKGFPFYCKDLKQTLDMTSLKVTEFSRLHGDQLKNHPNYPKQINGHNALDDAKWNLELYNFLNTI